MQWFWLALTIGLIVVEVATVQLVSVWFAFSAMITTFVTLIFDDLSIPWQATIFVVLSIVLLISTRPLVKMLLKKRGEKQKTNLELYIDKEAIVVEDIDNLKGTGAIKINGMVWSARSKDESNISKDEIVIFKEIIGNKAVVIRKGE
ncbi:MAG: NfeD family protein [Ruminococcaceae bacterium]|nr:NfeD family protein [Oscillospiraceae bacterium]